MGESLNAGEQLDWFLRKLSSLQAVSDALKKAGTLEAYIQEQTRLFEVVSKQLKTERATLDEVLAKQAASKKVAAEMARKAAADCDAILAEARASADTIKREAKAKAAQIVADAEARKAQIEDRARRLAEAVRDVA